MVRSQDAKRAMASATEVFEGSDDMEPYYTDVRVGQGQLGAVSHDAQELSVMNVRRYASRFKGSIIDMKCALKTKVYTALISDI